MSERNPLINSKLREGFILSTLPHQCSFSEDVRAGAQAWQGIGVDTGAMEVCSLPPCSSNLPVSFLIEVAPFGLGPPCQSLIKKIPYKSTYNLVFWKHFLNWAFSDDSSGLCQVDIKLVNRTAQWCPIGYGELSRATVSPARTMRHT